MGWKKVGLLGCVAPALGGCHLAQLAGHNLVNEPLVTCTERAIDRELRSDARVAWREVREQFPRRMFTGDFRDGFLDGYADYLARGGTAQPPAVPPLKYTRDKKYFTPEGHCQIRDYFLGFKYGIDVAVASGQRKFLTVPVLIAEKHDGPPTFQVPIEGDHIPPALPVPPEKSQPQLLGQPKVLPVPPGGAGELPKTDPPKADPPKIDPSKTNPPKVELPPKKDPPPKAETGIKPVVPWESPATVKPKADPLKTDPPTLTVPPPAEVGSKFGPGAADSGVKGDPATLLPVPNPPLPTIPVLLGTETIPTPKVLPNGDPVRPTPPARPKTEPPAGALRPAGFVSFPEPPAEVPTLPGHLPTPSVLDDLPVVPANHEVPPPLPANHTIPPAIPQQP